MGQHEGICYSSLLLMSSLTGSFGHVLSHAGPKKQQPFSEGVNIRGRRLVSRQDEQKTDSSRDPCRVYGKEPSATGILFAGGTVPERPQPKPATKTSLNREFREK